MKQTYSPPLDTKIKDTVFNIFDTETTGDNSRKEDKPIEIAAVKWTLKDGFLEIPKSWMIDPKMSIHPSAIAVHGIEDEELEGKPELHEVLPELHDYIKDTVLIAHNIQFDLNMLPTLVERDNVKMDSLRFARHIFKVGDIGHKNHDLRSHKSQELRYWLNIKVDTMGLQAHRAAADILVTGEVFKQLLTSFMKRTNATTLRELKEYIEAPMLVEKLSFGKFKGQNIEETIKEECKKSNNWFSWLLKQVNKGEMTIDEDLKYTIEYYLKKNNIDPVGLLVESSSKTWAGIAQQMNKGKSYGKS